MPLSETSSAVKPGAVRPTTPVKTNWYCAPCGIDGGDGGGDGDPWPGGDGAGGVGDGLGDGGTVGAGDGGGDGGLGRVKEGGAGVRAPRRTRPTKQLEGTPPYLAPRASGASASVTTESTSAEPSAFTSEKDQPVGSRWTLPSAAHVVSS